MPARSASQMSSTSPVTTASTVSPAATSRIVPPVTSQPTRTLGTSPAIASRVPERTLSQIASRTALTRRRSAAPLGRTRYPSRASHASSSEGLRHASAPFSRLTVLQKRRTRSSGPATPRASGQLPSGKTSPVESRG